MNKKLLYLFLILLASCGIGEKSSPNVFFTGEIVNPTSSHVVLFKGDVVIDSAKLDEQNRFSFRLDSITDGLYHFKHAPEYQYVYLKNGDSLVARLNTVAFDESLVFSGTGEDINNFLLELFLANEEERSTIYASYKMEPDEFSEYINSLSEAKFEQLDALKREGNLTDKEVKIAEASIKYEYNTFKERYPFINRKQSGSKDIKELPASFYDYRKELSYGDSDLTYLRPFYNFMNNHFGNISYMTCSDDCAIKNNMVKNQLHFNKHKLKLIDSIVVEKELKDNLFRNVAIDYLLKAHDAEENNKVFIELFHELSSNNEHIEEIEDLYHGIRNIQPNKELPEVYVQNVNGMRVSLKDISQGKKTIFYFWSGSEKEQFKELTKRINSLEEKKSDYQLIGINVKTEEPRWKSMVKSGNLDSSQQYRSDNFDDLTRSLIIHHLNKCIIAENGIIINAFSDIFSRSIEKEMAREIQLASH